MIRRKIHQKSPMRGPVLKNVLADLAGLVIQQLKGNVSIWFPALVIAGNTRGLAQLPQPARQSAHEKAARFAVMNNADNGWLGKGTIDHQVSFEQARGRAKHCELKFRMLRG